MPFSYRAANHADRYRLRPASDCEESARDGHDVRAAAPRGDNRRYGRDVMAAVERPTATPQLERRRMHRSRRFLLRMSVFLVLVAALAYGLQGPLLAAFLGNPAVNGVILGVLAAGIIYIFRQVMLLDPEIDWIESFREGLANRDLTAPPGKTPRLLGPMARMLGARQGGRVSLSATS